MSSNLSVFGSVLSASRTCSTSLTVLHICKQHTAQLVPIHSTIVCSVPSSLTHLLLEVESLRVVVVTSTAQLLVHEIRVVAGALTEVLAQLRDEELGAAVDWPLEFVPEVDHLQCSDKRCSSVTRRLSRFSPDSCYCRESSNLREATTHVH